MTSEEGLRDHTVERYEKKNMAVPHRLAKMLTYPLRALRRALDPIGYLRKLGVRVGSRCRIHSLSFGSEPYLVELGNHVAIADGVKFLTHDGAMWVCRELFDPKADIVKPIKVGNNVMIGLNALVLPGVTIGDNVIVGAGSVVSRDLPPNCVAAGIPAKPIKSVEEYWERCKQDLLDTHGMGLEQKRKFLMERFGIK